MPSRACWIYSGQDDLIGNWRQPKRPFLLFLQHLIQSTGSRGLTIVLCASGFGPQTLRMFYDGTRTTQRGATLLVAR
jgi:hypothetical protein